MILANILASSEDCFVWAHHMLNLAAAKALEEHANDGHHCKSTIGNLLRAVVM